MVGKVPFDTASFCRYLGNHSELYQCTVASVVASRECRSVLGNTHVWITTTIHQIFLLLSASSAYVHQHH